MILPIITAPDKRLKVKSQPVAAVDDDLRKLLDDMVETMRAAPGIGLSAIQVGVPKRVLVVELEENAKLSSEENAAPPADAPRTTRYLVNPEIVWSSERVVFCEEGCLSLPDQFAEIERPADIKVKYLDYHGQPQTLEAAGMLSRCIQHEMDHLEGKLFVDYLSELKRTRIRQKLERDQRHHAVKHPRETAL